MKAEHLGKGIMLITPSAEEIRLLQFITDSNILIGALLQKRISGAEYEKGYVALKKKYSLPENS